MFLVLSSSLHALEFKYETCNPSNNYLQGDLRSFISSNPTFFGHEQVCGASSSFMEEYNQKNVKGIYEVIDSTNLCLYASLMNNPLKPERGSRFPVCNGSTADEKAKAVEKMTYYDKKSGKNKFNRAPCVTKELHETMVKVFLTTTECTGIDKGAFFSILNHESRFQPNVGNSNGVYGVGQLTSIAASEVNRVYLERKKMKDFQYLREEYSNKHGVSVDSSENACNRMLGTLKKPFDIDTPDECAAKRKKKIACDKRLSPCERAAFPRNPLRNLLYASLLYKAD